MLATVWTVVVGIAVAVAQRGDAAPPVRNAGTIANGRALYLAGCSSCHGLAAQGVRGSGPSLRDAGAQAADFYLSTGRMPLDKPGHEPLRGESPYTQTQIDALVRYIGSLGGPPIPEVHPERGDLSRGQHTYALYCAGCHQSVGEGGVVPGGLPPELKQATPTQVAEAIRIGPFLMSAFTQKQIDQQALNDVARYVEYTKNPDDPGGWSIGHIGPVPEGMVTWLIGLAALIGFTRLLGDRIER